jgi:hypothetical protein
MQVKIGSGNLTELSAVLCSSVLFKHWRREANWKNAGFYDVFAIYFFHEWKRRHGRVKCARKTLGKNGVFGPNIWTSFEHRCFAGGGEVRFLFGKMELKTC